MNSLLTNDLSSIDQDDTIESCKLSESFPVSMFDDKEDAIYGASLVSTLIGFIFTLLRMLNYKDQLENSDENRGKVRIEKNDFDHLKNF